MAIDSDALRARVNSKEQEARDNFKRSQKNNRYYLTLSSFRDGDTFLRFFPPDAEKNPQGVAVKHIHKLKQQPLTPAIRFYCTEMFDPDNPCPACMVADEVMHAIENKTLSIDPDTRAIIADLAKEELWYHFIGVYASEIKETQNGQWTNYEIIAEPASKINDGTAKLIPIVLITKAKTFNKRLLDISEANPMFNDLLQGTVLKFHKNVNHYELDDTRAISKIPDGVMKDYPNLKTLAESGENSKKKDALTIKVLIQNSYWFQNYGMNFDTLKQQPQAQQILTDLPQAPPPVQTQTLFTQSGLLPM